MPTSDQTIKWIENLADQERQLPANGHGTIDLCSTKEEVLEMATSLFLRELFYQIEYLVKLFNGRVSSSSLQMRLLRSEEGVSINRGGMRLSAKSVQPGMVQVQCEKASETIPRYESSVMFSGLIEGNFETFHDVGWYFLGSSVSPELVARHYLTEFLQVSRTTS